MSHQVKQFVIDANKCVLNKPTPEAKVESGTFEENEAWAIDIVLSTGEGKPKVGAAPRREPVSEGGGDGGGGWAVNHELYHSVGFWIRHAADIKYSSTD